MPIMAQSSRRSMSKMRLLPSGRRRRPPALSGWADAGPSLLILDEPTNHLDIDSMEAVETGLRAYDGAPLLVSHDESFREAIGISRRLELSPTVQNPRVSRHNRRREMPRRCQGATCECDPDLVDEPLIERSFAQRSIAEAE
jgi:ATPase subunit of ABC transporter with duplicated ATPase domains